MTLASPVRFLTMTALIAASPVFAQAASVEVTLSSNLPTAPTGVLLKDGAIVSGAVIGVSSYGAIFQSVLPTKTNPHWSVRILYAFDDYDGDGAYPAGALVADKAGNLYGATFGGGAGANPGGNGTLYKLMPPSASQANWVKQTIYRFQTQVVPQGKLAVDAAGNLYLPSAKSVLQFTPPASGAASYTMTAIPIVAGYQANASNGVATASGVVIDRFGNIYGVAKTIATSPPATEIVYQLTPPATSGTQWTGRILQSFPSTATVGQLGLSPNGHLFGATSPQGALCDAANCAVFELVQARHGSWTEQIVHSFASDPLGSPPSNETANPYAPHDYQLSFGPAGSIYGAIIPSQAKTGANSTIYRLTPPASGQTTWAETALYTFQGTPAGFLAGTPLYIAGNGAVYGTAYGGTETNGYLQSILFKIAAP